MTALPPTITPPPTTNAGRLGEFTAVVERALRLAPGSGTIDIADLTDPRDFPRTSLTAGDGPGVTVRRVPDGLVVAATPGGRYACPRCFDRRWIAARRALEQQVIDDPHGVKIGPLTPLGPGAEVVVRSLIERARDPRALEGPVSAVWHTTLVEHTITRWGLMKDSGCEECGAQEVDDLARARVALTSVPVTRGAARAGRVEDLHLPSKALANPVCGVLGGLPIRAYHATASAPTSGRFHVRSKYGFHELWWSGHAESYARSELLGLLEGLERAAGQRPTRFAEPRWARLAELELPAVEMETCGVYSEQFYRAHDAKYVRWEEAPRIPWVHGWSLRDNRAIMVPEQLAYYLDHRRDHRNTVQECSNGCASGANVTEAVLHGLLELLERDSFLLSWYCRIPPREVDLDTVDDPLVQHMRQQVDVLGYDLRCFDTRVDLPVPTIGCVAVRREPGPGMLCFAGGAGIDPVDAVRAAVSEVASYVPGFADRVERKAEFLEAAIEDPRLITELEHHALLYGMPQMAHHARHWLEVHQQHDIGELFADWSAIHRPSTDLRDPARLIVDLLAHAGLDTIAVDQTSPEEAALGVHTVATIVPGLIPIDFGWDRQRVLTMPRTRWAHFDAGLSDHPLSPGELLAVPHPFP